jgi:hypothetical protein
MKIVVFDLDETLGYFTQLGIFWDSLGKYLKTSENIKLTQNDFNKILDLFPEFLRPNIINILNYLKTKKKSTCCHKIMIYTNNNGPREWAEHIINYFESKIDYKIVDQIIAAFKVNGKQVEICRTTHNKTHSDFIQCTKLPSNAEICFLDDTFYPGMSNEYIYYINIKPYYYNLELSEILNRFKKSEIGKKLINMNDDFDTKITNIFKSYNYDYVIKDSKEYELDKIIGKQIIKHLQSFFNNKNTNNKTIKNKNNNNNISKKNKKNKKNKK